MTNMIKKCPACGNELLITKLSCRKCNIELTGEFVSSEFSVLNEKEIAFIKEFLLSEGNFTKVQSKMNITYPYIKETLNEIAIKLGIKNCEDENKVALTNLIIDEENSIVVKTIKEKLQKAGGSTFIPMLRGDDIKIWLSNDGEGIIAEGLKNVVLEWEIFDAIVKKAISLGGEMYRGDGAAQSGKKIGSEDLSLDTIDGFISVNYYGKTIGDTTLRRSTYFSGILAWAGIADNCRSKGAGGYIKIRKEYMK